MKYKIFKPLRPPAITDELQRYRGRKIPDPDEEVNVIQWWISNKKRYPILYEMAMDFFAVPAQSAECERTFSHAGGTVTRKRGYIIALTIEAIKCLKSWERNGMKPFDEIDNSGDETESEIKYKGGGDGAYIDDLDYIITGMGLMKPALIS